MYKNNMINHKNQKTILVSALIFTFSLVTTLSYFFVVWIPDNTRNIFGSPGSDLDFSKKILLSTKLFVNRKELHSVQIHQNDPIPFTVSPGQTSGEIAVNLQDAGIVQDADFLVDYWIYKDYDQLIQSGVYMIQPGSTLLSIGERLVDSTPDFIHFAFLAGWRIEEIEHLLKNSGILDSEKQIMDYLDYVNQNCLPESIEPLKDLEGYLFPGDYLLPFGAFPEEVVCSFVQQFFNSIPPDYQTLVEEQGLAFHEAVILASIIQKEVVDNIESPLIAGVFLNRLEANMLLQSDPTVQYAIAQKATSSVWWKNPLESDDLDFDSPFNTYIYDGLPPSPICNPDLNSLLAVAAPERANNFYFRSSCDQSGRHVFNETYQDHLDAECN